MNKNETTSEIINRFLNHRYVKPILVAYDLYPDVSKDYAKSKFSNKFKKKNGQRFLEHEEKRILELYQEFKKEIDVIKKNGV